MSDSKFSDEIRNKLQSFQSILEVISRGKQPSKRILKCGQTNLDQILFLVDKLEDNPSGLPAIQSHIRQFVRERDWEQFHSPKNLSMSISVEAAELMEHFQWTNTVDEAVKVLKDKRKKADIEDEVADIAIYLIDFCNLYNVDLYKAILRKMKKNAKKYPIKLVKGKMEKYTFYKASGAVVK